MLGGSSADDTDRYFLCSYFFFTAVRCLFEAQIAGSQILSATSFMHFHSWSASNPVYSIKIFGWQVKYREDELSQELQYHGKNLKQ